MKRKVFLAAIAALMLAASCGKEDGDDSAIVQQPTTESVSQTGSQNEEETVATTRPIVIRATKGESLSKVLSSDGHTLTFEAGDKLTLKYADGSKCIDLEMDGDFAGQSTATFKGDIPTAADNQELYAEIGTELTGVESSAISLADVVSKKCYVKSVNFTYDPSKEITNVFLSDQNAYIAISLSPFSKTTSVTVNTTEVELSDYKQVWVAVKGGTEVSISELSVSNKSTVAGKIYKVNRNAFSVSATTKVHFSTGNLQYNASASPQWRFADKQYDYIGGSEEGMGGNVKEGETNCTNTNLAGPWIDLFGWGTWVSGQSPTESETTNSKYYYDESGVNGVKSGDISKEANKITVGGKEWRVLTDTEWQYLLGISTDKRTNATNLCKWRTVNSVNGLVILPDGCTENIDGEWSTLEAAGAVFLPAAGRRNGTSVYDAGSYGYYWSSSANGASYAWYVNFYSGSVNRYDFNRYVGRSVRLVRGL